MSLKGNYTPFNLNAISALMQGSGLTINPRATSFMGSSTSTSNYTKGTVVTNTVLNRLVDSINVAYNLIGTNPSTQITQATYNNLISIGSTTIPALGAAKPSTYTGTYTGQLTRYGFIKLFAKQAYDEFHLNTGSYTDFLASFTMCDMFRTKSNKVIDSFHQSIDFMEGSFSNTNDLITSDITGVSMSTLYWGQDLIASGRVIDLSTIDTFGLPSNLLRTLYKNRALTKAVNLALLSAGLSSTDIDSIVNGATATIEQEKNIYGAFNIIMGTDLVDVCVPINNQTPLLDSLADLLDPKKLFPNSFKTLTFPVYNATAAPTNSKTYYFIYSGGEANVLSFTNFGTRLRNIMPESLAYTCDAFANSMQQIKNIKQMNIEKFSQVVTHLEITTDLNTGASSVPTARDLALNSLSALALGSGNNGTYTTCDFFGCMSGESYDWNRLQGAINGLATPQLEAIYKQIYDLVITAGPYTTLQTLIDNANTEIANIKNRNTFDSNALNILYNSFGTKLLKEQQARTLAIPSLTDLTSSVTNIYGFIDSIDTYALETQDFGSSRVIEAIADTTTVGGNSIIGSMRESRNAHRLGLSGLELDNDVVSNEIVTPRTGPDPGYSGSNINIPVITGVATTPGSLAGSPEAKLIPKNLSIFNIPTKVLTPDEAVHEVTLCNCDCWDQLQ